MSNSTHIAPPLFNRAAETLPPHLWFGVSAVFHYLGPAFAVLLFPAVGVLGVAWFRIVSAAAVLALISRPLQHFAAAAPRERLLLLALGLSLAAMNCAFYLALERLPIALVAAIEFLGTVMVALWGLRCRRNLIALGLTVLGVLLLIGLPSLWLDSAFTLDGVGLLWAALNGGLFVCYVVLGHRAAAGGAGTGVARLGSAMMIACVAVMPIGLWQAMQVFGAPLLVLAGVGVGLCSSVIPYICDQLAMSRLPRRSFALMLALLPATATVIGMVVLQQIPSVAEAAGVVLVMAGVALHGPLQV